MTTAVLITGDYRLFPKCAPHLFKYFDKHYENVHYYISVWATTRDFWWPEQNSVNSIRNVTNTEIESIFAQHNKKLISCRTSVSDTIEQKSFYYQAKLCQLANADKQIYEANRGFIYNQVIEIRPDIYISGGKTPPPVVAKAVHSNASIWIKDGKEMLQDFYYRSTSQVSNILAERGSYRPTGKASVTPTENEQLNISYFRKNKLRLVTTDYLDSAFIVRPNFPEDLTSVSFEQSLELDREWLEYQWQGVR